MSNTAHTGRVSFVNHEKKYIIIEYDVKGKKKVVNGSTNEKNLKAKHVFHIGDTVSFTAGLSGRGDKIVASGIKFLYNNALDVLLNKARTDNHFTGYLKIVDDKYFVKEIDSYLFFPVVISPWQAKLSEAELNEAVTFALINLDKKEKVSASLQSLKFIPEYYSAERAFKKNETITAVIYKITGFGIYLNIFGEKVQAKILPDAENLQPGLQVGDKLAVRITHFSNKKIVVEPVL